ncbi:hypothetical protein SK128_021789 [Halocaridina rubra]|uniref:Homeodomain-like domain-containing protein n=1 Tax=Halocaridina rubra TaxID=373956 RepID=A0AAN8WT19_HALRR
MITATKKDQAKTCDLSFRMRRAFKSHSRVTQMPSNRPQRLSVRVHMLWLWFQGYSVRDISDETKSSTTTVYRWIRRWQHEGHALELEVIV